MNNFNLGVAMDKIDKDAILKDVSKKKKLILLASIALIVLSTVMIVSASYACKFNILKLTIITFIIISVSTLFLLELNNKILLIRTLETMLDNYHDVYNDGNDGLFRKISGFVSIYFKHLKGYIKDDKYTKYTEGAGDGN
jgi:high-affinity nickel permease